MWTYTSPIIQAKTCLSIFLLFVFTMTIAMKGWFRAIAALFSADAIAQSFAGISVLAIAIYTGK